MPPPLPLLSESDPKYLKPLKSEEVKGIKLIRAKHPGKWKYRYDLPDMRHNIDQSLIQYLDKGKFGEYDVFEVPKDFNGIKDFKLYFKPLGAKEKEKVLGDD